MLELLEFNEEIESNIINDRSPTVKFLTSVILLASIFIENSLFNLIIIFTVIISFSVISQGLRKIVQIYWSLKFYFLLVMAVSLIFNGFQINEFIIITLIKLLSIFIAFAFFSKTTSPERLIDVLIQLKIPAGIAWSIGVAFRQAILILDDVAHIQTIQRLRGGYQELSPGKKFTFRIKEIYIMLVSILARSILISTEFAIAIKMRGWEKAHRNIVLENSPVHISDYLFLVLVVGFSLSILMIL